LIFSQNPLELVLGQPQLFRHRKTRLYEFVFCLIPSTRKLAAHTGNKCQHQHFLLNKQQTPITFTCYKEVVHMIFTFPITVELLG